MFNLDSNQPLPNEPSVPSYLQHINLVAPRPTSIEQTGLSQSLLQELLLKHLLAGGVLTKQQMVTKLGVCGGIIGQLLDSAKNLGLVENRQTTTDAQMRFTLSFGGEAVARQASLRSGYIGLAPVPLSQYLPICRSQSSRNHHVTSTMLEQAFSSLILPEQLLAQIGPALNSSRPILIYGPPGTGKSYVCRHLNLLFGDAVLIPYAIAIGNEIIQVFDPQLHHKITVQEPNPSLQLTQGHDPRWLQCQRPLRVTGGELTADMLEVRFDPHSKTYMAPLQLKANNGILLIDDLGRQKISTKQLFNRWIIPMEERRDFLALQSGEYFEIPFELVLLFSTNLDPNELVDEAFLRRLGYKIHFNALAQPLYHDIWFETCEELAINCSEETYQHLLGEYHQRYDRLLMPCYPRDLLGIVSDQIKFKALEPVVTPELIESAWSIYFVK